MPSSDELLQLRADAFADDVEIPAAATSWTRTQAIAFFESGGQVVPDVAQPISDRPLKFLCLHGGGGNKSINKLQTSKLKVTMGGDAKAQMDFLEGTRVWDSNSVDPTLKKMFGEGPYYGWYGVENDRTPKDAQGAVHRAAMFDPTVNFTYVEVDECLDRVEAHIDAHGPYDVLLGFSQCAYHSSEPHARPFVCTAAAAVAKPCPQLTALLLFSLAGVV